MKKLFYLCIIFSCLLNGYKVQAQLLNAGDAVVSMSGRMWSNNQVSGPNYVLEILRTRNTSPFPIGTGWTPMTAAAFNSFAYRHPSWVRDTMGNVFGLAIDNNRNIYVAATGFYGPQVAGIKTGQIWRVDGNTGAVTAMRDLHAGNPNQNCLGNLKVFGNILYVADLRDGLIYAVSLTSPYNIISTFDPTTIPADLRKPHGLAVRNMPGGARLFFSLNEFNAATTEIWSVGINATGITGGLQNELSNFTLKNLPITDIAFNSDFSRMILAERTSYTWTSSSAHQSTVREYQFNGTNWVLPSAGYSYSIPGGCTGGLSFSKAVIQKNAEFRCDTTIWATSDYMYSTTYGMTGFKHQNGQGMATGINIDFDNDIMAQDKSLIGDVEVCDTTIACANCACGQWGQFPIGLTLPGSPVSFLKPCGSSQSFTSGQVGGTLYVSYTCIGNCNRTINWQLINTVTNLPVGNGNANAGSINLSQFNNLPCGSYKFIFTPTCGTTTCPPCEFFINIVCDPPPCCPLQTQVIIQPQNANYNSSNNPNGWGTYSQAFILNSNVPMGEIRIDVEHFELTSTDPDCISCRNIPKTWGSLLGAAYNGNGFTTPISSLPFTSSGYGNGRELVYKPGFLISINNGVVNVNVAMPNASPIDCCVLTANLCLKFTFKDANCIECTYLYCNQNIEITQSANGNPNGNQLKNVNKTVQKSIF